MMDKKHCRQTETIRAMQAVPIIYSRICQYYALPILWVLSSVCANMVQSVFQVSHVCACITLHVTPLLSKTSKHPV